MNQHQQPASSVQGTPAATEPVKSTQPQARISLSLKLGIGNHGDEYGDSKAEVLVWALTGYKNDLYRQLVRACREGDEESLIEAGAYLTSLELCDEMLTDIVVGLRSAATENAAIIRTLTDSRYKMEPKELFKDRCNEKIAKILVR